MENNKPKLDLQCINDRFIANHDFSLNFSSTVNYLSLLASTSASASSSAPLAAASPQVYNVLSEIGSLTDSLANNRSQILDGSSPEKKICTSALKNFPLTTRSFVPQIVSLSSSACRPPAHVTGRSDALLTDIDDLFSKDKHDMIDRIFNFNKETVHRFPSAHQDQHDEDLLNRLILQCIGTTSRPATWNLPSTYISPYTPIKPSKMHINDLPQDCIEHLVDQFKSLQDLVAKAFVCPAWVPAVAKIISGRTHSLKVFDSEENIELYQEHALMQYNLARLDLAAGVRQIRERKEDHIFVRFFRGHENNLVKNIIETIFSKVTYLVLHTHNIDQACLIRCMEKLTSITLFAPPDMQQNAIWEALNAAPELRHVHIFYSNGNFPFQANKMDFLTRIESFTLDNYTKGNLFNILERLGPQLRCLQIGPFANGDEVLERLIKQNPDMVAKLTQLSVLLDGKSMGKAPSDELYDESYLVHKKMLKLIVDNFPELTYLDMEFASLMFFTDVIDSLSKLPKLTELRFANRKTNSGFLGWPSTRQLQGVPNHRRQPTPLPNISKVYLTKNSPYEDYPFLCHLFADDQIHFSRKQAIENARRHGYFSADANAPHVFPGIEQVTYVLNRAKTGSGNSLCSSMRNTIPPEYWLRLRLYNVTVGTMNEHFFARDEDDVAQHIRERNSFANSIKNARRGLMPDRVNQFIQVRNRLENPHDNARPRMDAIINAFFPLRDNIIRWQNHLQLNDPRHEIQIVDVEVPFQAENPLQDDMEGQVNDIIQQHLQNERQNAR